MICRQQLVQHRQICIIIKGVTFEEVHTLPSQDDAFKLISPMGRVHFIETNEGFFSKSMAIIEYIDKLGSGRSLTATAPFQAAKIHELARVLELYLEAPTRHHYGEIFFGGERDEVAFKEARPLIENSLKAVKQLASFGP